MTADLQRTLCTISVSKAAVLLAVDRKTVRRMFDRRELRWSWVGGRRKTSMAEIERVASLPDGEAEVEEVKKPKVEPGYVAGQIAIQHAEYERVHG